LPIQSYTDISNLIIARSPKCFGRKSMRRSPGTTLAVMRTLPSTVWQGRQKRESGFVVHVAFLSSA
jgi:hypothetical protein